MKSAALLFSLLLSLQTTVRQPLWEPPDGTDDGGVKATVAHEFVTSLQAGETQLLKVLGKPSRRRGDISVSRTSST